MEIIIIILAVLQSVAISLGVGASTLAIANFFVAIADGEIDAEERRMMGIVYVVLRISMVLILLTTLLLLILDNTSLRLHIFAPYAYAQWVLVFSLYLNAILMTKHIMPSKYGPAIQAASWYTLGIIAALVPLGYADFTLIEFFAGYGFMVILYIGIVRGLMVYLKHRHSQKV